MTYAEKMISEIDLYLSNLSKMETIDIEPFQKAYYDYIEENNNVIQSIASIVKENTKKNQSTTKDTIEKHLSGYCEWVAKNYKRSLENLHNHPDCREIRTAAEMVEAVYRGGYSLMNYNNLCQLLYLYPGQVQSMELNENCSIPCRELYKNLFRSYCINLQKQPTYKELKAKAYKKISYPSELISPNNAILDEIFNVSFSETPVEMPVDPEQQRLYQSVIDYAVENGKITVSMIQRKFSLGYGAAGTLLERMETDGIIGPREGAKPQEVLIQKKITAPLPSKENKTTVYIVTPNSSSMETLNSAHEECFERPIFEINCLRPAFLQGIKELLKSETITDLPDLIIALRKDELNSNIQMAKDFLKFRDLYRETPEQIMKTNHVYYAEKNLQQLAENARLEREMQEEQAELNRIAEAENARLIADAEAASMNEMRIQAEKNRRLEEEQRRVESNAARCLSCANALYCKMKNIPGICGAYRSKY